MASKNLTLQNITRMSSSSSSAIEISSDYQSPPPISSVYHHRQCEAKRNLSTDLRLGLSISPPKSDLSSASSLIRKPKEKSDLPPINPLLRITLAGKPCNRRPRRRREHLLIKVFMEGIPFGRKVDLSPHDGYDSLISALSSMFEIGILRPRDTDYYRCQMNYHNVLIYEDKEGDWMMCGDVPWEMFLSTAKMLKITRGNIC